MTDIFGKTVTTPGAYTTYSGGSGLGGYTEQPGQVTLVNPGELVTPRPSDDQLTAMIPGYQAPAAATTPASASTTPATPATSTTPAMDATQQSAWAVLAQTLQSYGFNGTDLQNLEDFIQKELINGTSDAQINLDLMQTKEFANRFPAIIARRNAGLTPISPADYINLEDQYTQIERSAGLPPNFGDFDALIANDVSPSELSSRVQQGYIAMLQAPPEAMQALQDYYGINQGTMAAYFLDPEKAAPLVVQQAQAAILGGAGIRSGFGEPTAAQSLKLAQLGISPDQAQAGFMDLAHQQQLEGTLPGQSQQALTSDQLIGSEFEGDQATKDLLAQRAAEQKANFQANTGFGTTSSGVTGLGSVTR
jgi:hypothetical protein